MRRARALAPAVAGSWYPRDPDALAALVDDLLDRAAERTRPGAGPVAGLIVPHAGFAYSGAVAASAFARLRGCVFDRVVVVGPSHHFGFPGAAVPEPDTAFYRTPLGDIAIDREAVAALAARPGFRPSDRMFEPEHAIEAELPFLQRALAGATPIVPVLVGGGASSEDAAHVAAAVAPLLRDALVVISSDFTHFGPRFDYVPFTDDVPGRIRALDLGAIHAIESGDVESFSAYVATTGATICGHRAIEVLLHLRSASRGAALLEYDTSGRMTERWDHSVSYAALAVPSVHPESR